jgi:hypothetical protein
VKFFGVNKQIENIKLLSTLGNKKIQDVQFDEMETHIHTKLKPVSIALAVDEKKRKILGFTVSIMPAKGLLAEKSRQKYGQRPDLRVNGLEQLFNQIKPAIDPKANFLSDSKPLYPKYVKKHFPEATHKTVEGKRGCIVGQGELKKVNYDPLFMLNHTCAMIRDNVKRLSRKTWCTSKTIEGLVNHLHMYVHYHNTVLT